MQEVYIVSAVRTPIASFQGAFSSKSATELGAIVVREAVKRAGISPEDVQECIMGNVLSAGLGQAPARQAAIFGGLPVSVEALTINKMCGSGLKAIMLAAQAIAVGDMHIGVAGGMESMTNAPYLLTKARSGYRYGNAELIDSMQHDGLLDVYNKFLMGNAAELCAKECNVSREAQDEFAICSYTRALKAQKEGWFKDEIVAVEWEEKGKKMGLWEDEEPKNFRPDKIPTLKPVFQKDGTVTAANASKINDGAAAVVVASAEAIKQKGLKPMAKILAYATAAKQPEYFTTAPIDAIPKVLKRANLSLKDIDLFEVNEAFAVVALAARNALGIPDEKLNVHGGAVALGHPIGASGARILTTLLYALKHRGLKRGLAAICLGGGEACAMIVELV
ncbi:MAG: thiolase family protein [Candidatus Thermochlorobacter aerophilum]|jgi:acetyl-CoA C-acetyltransferase|uniref:acetyl-CoA C-acetyltransferase n=1 Tax=Candidatus Thermochlorobacter aerophilus TaxID=1868324 RepID=A0A395M2Z6_9BACT|nr:MAG: thiolase family protein [Candidatus Thermochlorobacter aerophilum]